MTVGPKLMTAAGLAVAGLGLIGAGAGATFTAQVGASTSITTGDIGLSLNGRTGHDLQLDVDGSNLGTHFAPLRKDLLLKNTGTLDIAATYLDLTATGCGGGSDAPLAHALRVTVTDVTHSRQVYDGDLCSADRDLSSPAAHGAQRQSADSGQLPAGDSVRYQLVLQPMDIEQGLSPAAQSSRTSVKVLFTGYDS